MIFMGPVAHVTPITECSTRYYNNSTVLVSSGLKVQLFIFLINSIHQLWNIFLNVLYNIYVTYCRIEFIAKNDLVSSFHICKFEILKSY